MAEETMTLAQARLRWPNKRELDDAGKLVDGAYEIDLEAAARDGWGCRNDMVDGAETYLVRTKP